MKAYKYTAVGKYPFPMDMLRYDCSYPAEASAVSRIESGSRGPEGYRDRHTLRIRLISHVRPPTVGRWNSFGWQIEDQEEVKL